MAHQIKVKYEIISDWHVFTSEDLEGFLVASKNADKAFADVAPVMGRLLKYNKGFQAVKVEPLKPLSAPSHREKEPSAFGGDLSYVAVGA